jgi:hypothetical protein
LVGTLSTRADNSGAPETTDEVSAQPPKKGPGKLPKAGFQGKGPEGKFNPKGKLPPPRVATEVRHVRVVVNGYGPYGIAYGYWPGPVLPGMWGGVYGGLWPNSWWLGGPYLYSGWTGTWGQGWGNLHGGSWPTILPPVFGPVAYPAVSPYWVPRVAPFWLVPAAGWPYVIAKADLRKREREYRPVPASASSDKLYADALWLFWDNNFESARDHLAAAIKQSPRDARLWYYKALSERELGNDQAALRSAENGAALEILAVTDKRLILTALERIQGVDRTFLTNLVSGPKAISVRSAAEIVANLAPAEPTTLTSSK